MITLGIDNGAEGAFVALDAHGALVFAKKTPTLDVGVTRNGKRGTKRALDLPAVRELLSYFGASDFSVYAVLEHAQAFPGEGVSTSFSAGRSYGAIEGMLVALRIPYEIVRPQAWQAVVLKGVDGVDTKARAILRAQRAVPALDLTPGRSQKPHTGLADAACLALYGLTRRT
jgi:hypothetical protein